MYDELVKQLRELPHLLFVQLHGHEDMVYKAADAIEELDNLLNLYRQGKIHRTNNDLPMVGKMKGVKAMKKEYIIRDEAMTIPVLPREQRVKFRNIDEAFEAGWKTCQEYIATCIEPADVISRHEAIREIKKIFSPCGKAGNGDAISREVVLAKLRNLKNPEQGADTGYPPFGSYGDSVTIDEVVKQSKTAPDVQDINREPDVRRQLLNNQLVIMGALDDMIMHGGGNQWATVHPALPALHDGMAKTSAILAQSQGSPKKEANET